MNSHRSPEQIQQLRQFLNSTLSDTDQFPDSVEALLWLESEDLLSEAQSYELAELSVEYPEIEQERQKIRQASNWVDAQTEVIQSGFSVVRGSTGIQAFRGSRRVDTSMYQLARNSMSPVTRVEENIDAQCGRLKLIIEDDVDESWSLTVCLEVISPRHDVGSLSVRLIGKERTSDPVSLDLDQVYEGLESGQYGLEVKSSEQILDFIPLTFNELTERNQ